MLAAEGEAPRRPATTMDRVNAEFVAFRKAKGLPYDPALEPDYAAHYGRGA